MLDKKVTTFIQTDILERFCRYVKVHTTSDYHSECKPSTARQLDLLNILKSELEELGLEEVTLDAKGYVYATLPARQGTQAQPFGLLAHVDTSPDQSGEGVNPTIHRNWDGSAIRFADDPALTLTEADSAELKNFVGDTIITASGKTLLGADDKAGVAEIMSALAALKKFPELSHGQIEICFTSDEEVGRGTEGINLARLPKFLYTIDGGYPGELEIECFDAWGVTLEFQGRGVHPGYSYGKMINAARVASLFVACLPESELPETTRDRDGFYHLSEISGKNESAKLGFIIRDFDKNKNLARIENIKSLIQQFEEKLPGLKILIDTKHQYENMRSVINQFPEVVDLARQAIADTGIKVIERPIRGGTDGSKLTVLGHPTPNIFAGGLLFHSRREYIALSALTKATETIINLARRWVS